MLPAPPPHPVTRLPRGPLDAERRPGDSDLDVEARAQEARDRLTEWPAAPAPAPADLDEPYRHVLSLEEWRVQAAASAERARHGRERARRRRARRVTLGIIALTASPFAAQAVMYGLPL